MSKPKIRWVLAIVTIAALAAYAAYVMSTQSALSHDSATQAPDHAARSATGPNSAQVGAPVQRALQSYGAAIGNNMFTAPQLNKHAGPVTQEPAPHAASPQLPALPPSDPLADAVYAGSVTIDGKTMALIESRSTKQGVYVEAGQDRQGFRVLAVSPGEVSVSVSGMTRHLPKSDNINFVPLAANAPGRTEVGLQVAEAMSQAGSDAPTAVLQELNVVPVRDGTVDRLEASTDLYLANSSDPGPPVIVDFDVRS